MKLPTHWLGVAPFFLFALLFLILPTFKIVLGAFQTPKAASRLDNIAAQFTPSILAAIGSRSRSASPRPCSAA